MAERASDVAPIGIVHERASVSVKASGSRAAMPRGTLVILAATVHWPRANGNGRGAARLSHCAETSA